MDSDVLESGKIRIACREVRAKGGSGSAGTDAGIAHSTLAIRIPDWCDSYTLSCGTYTHELKKGYEYISGAFKQGDVIELEFKRSVRVMEASTSVPEDHGKVALSYGPFVYCIEEKDNGKDLHLFSVSTDPAKAKLDKITIEGDTVTKIVMPGKKERPRTEALYSAYKKPEYDDIELTFIPYYTWANRGEGEMRVWVNAFTH